MVIKDATPLTPLAHERNSIFKCIPYTIHDPRGPEHSNISQLFFSENQCRSKTYVQQIKRLCLKLFHLPQIGIKFNVIYLISYYMSKCYRLMKNNQRITSFSIITITHYPSPIKKNCENAMFS